MAQQQHGIVLDRDQFCCYICEDLLKEPVALPCGHSNCRSCIEGSWEQYEETGVYRCPQCKERFSPRPALRKNNMLAEVVEKLRNTGGQSSPSTAPAYAGPTDVVCDVCTGTRCHKALMSCLVCQVSFCETHLQPHYNVRALKKHKLVPATARLQAMMCSSHGKLMEVFCRTDQQCICYLCVMDEHKGHDTVSAAAERTEKQKHLGTSQQKVQQKIQERKKELKNLRQAIETLKNSAEAVVEASDKIFSELMVSVERRRSEIKELIWEREETAVAQAEGLLMQLEEEIAELERRHADLEELSNTDDLVHFIQSFQSLSSSSGSPSVVVPTLSSFTDVSDAVSGLRDKLDDILKTPVPEMSERLSAVNVLHPPEPQTREDFLQYSCPLSLDPNTVHNNLYLHENSISSRSSRDDPHPDHPKRFTYYHQVLCRESLSERCYWEVEWVEGRWIYIAVSYEDINREARYLSGFGFNDKSWCLRCLGDEYWFTHNSVDTKVSGPTPWPTYNYSNDPEVYYPPSSRVGVYLDHKAGTLSFYTVSDTMSLLHTVETTFTQPLYPGITLHCRENDNYSNEAGLCKIW